MIQEDFLSIHEFEELMKRFEDLRKSFEDCIRDMRKCSIFKYTDVIKESHKNILLTKIFIIHTDTECIFTARLLDGPRCKINMVYTNPLYRNQGYCSNSLRKLVNKCVDKNVYLHVKKTNNIAIHCYQKAEFRKTKSMGHVWEMSYIKDKLSI